MSATATEIQALLAEMSGVGEDKDYILKQFQALHDQLNQTTEWFGQINRLVGADPEEPAVNSVSDFVHKANLDREVLEHIRDENEVNKKNIFKFATENMELREDNKILKDQIDMKEKRIEQVLAEHEEKNCEINKLLCEKLHETLEENKKIKKLEEERQEFRDWVDRNQAEIDRLRDLIDGETSEEESDSDEE